LWTTKSVQSSYNVIKANQNPQESVATRKNKESTETIITNGVMGERCRLDAVMLLYGRPSKEEIQNEGLRWLEDIFAWITVPFQTDLDCMLPTYLDLTKHEQDFCSTVEVRGVKWNILITTCTHHCICDNDTIGIYIHKRKAARNVSFYSSIYCSRADSPMFQQNSYTGFKEVYS
jgi:hypothetical protein